LHLATHEKREEFRWLCKCVCVCVAVWQGPTTTILDVYVAATVPGTL